MLNLFAVFFFLKKRMKTFGIIHGTGMLIEDMTNLLTLKKVYLRWLIFNVLTKPSHYAKLRALIFQNQGI